MTSSYQILAFITFSMVMLYTPGPNNSMLAVSGANFGLQRTIPHLLGVSLGFGFMVFLVGLGAGQIMQTSPIVQRIMRLGGILFILWFAWKIASVPANKPGEDVNISSKAEKRNKPLTFIQATLFQWINGKAWMITASMVSTYISSASYLSDLLIVCILTVIIGISSSVCWTLFGVFIGRFISTGLRLRIFNITMAVLLVVSVILPEAMMLYKNP